MLWSNFYSVTNSANSAFANCGLLSVHRDSGIPCSANNSFMIDNIFAALHWNAGTLQTVGIFE